ncbi:MAG: glycosyltransferase [Thermoguttaceae bacterium]|nr:glycosyltransferase [Thermoguttaceae bacterium]MDW8038772.1 glycosyltransferase [Thermoguttaceae bacterium]
MSKSDRPTVCQLLHSLQIGGAEVLAADLARGLADRYRFIFICLDNLGRLAERLQTEGFPVVCLGRRPGFDGACIFRLARLWREYEVDVVHAHQYTPFFYAACARAWRGRPPILFTEHGRWYPDYPRRRRILFNRLVLRGRDRVTAVGQAVREALVRNEGLPRHRIRVIYNGVDVGRFAPRPERRLPVREALGLTPTDFVIIQVARLDYLKDHITAVRTMARLVRQVPEARLLLVGQGPKRPLIQAEIQAQGLEGVVHLLGEREDVPQLLWAADVAMLTSISEGIPVTLIEAMAAELPVVATKVGGVPEVVLHEQTGLLGPVGDDEQLAQYLIRLATDRSLRCRLGQAGRRRAEEIFAQPLMHQQYAECFDEMLS